MSAGSGQVQARVVPYGRGASRAETIADMEETTPDSTFDAARLRTVLELRRPVDDRMVAGVCTGLARYLRVDPVVVRVLLATLSVVGGLGLILYGTVWLLTPEEGSDRAPLGRVDELAEGGTRTVVLLVAGALALAAIVGPGVLWWGPWPGLVVVGVVVWLLLRDRNAAGSPQSPAEGTTQVLEHGSAPPPPTAPPAPPGPPSAPPPPPAASPRQARRDGGRLTVLALGVVGLVAAGAWVLDLAGEPVEAPVVIAIALGVVGAAIAVGTVFGNGRPLIFPALLLGAALAVTSVLPTWTVGERQAHPTTAAQVADDYELGVGRQVIDLTSVADLEALDGRTVRVDTGVGETVVAVPEGLDVTVDADIGVGELVVFDERSEHGPDSDLQYADADTSAPDFELVLRGQIGRIEVERS